MNNIDRAKVSQLLYTTLWLFVITLIFRFPFWFKDVIGWDESTFIIMGKSILDGYLPYVNFWDLKPPFAFVNVAIFLSILGNSIVAVRLGGALYVFLSSLLVYLISLKIVKHSEAIIASSLCVPMMTIFWSGQSTLTEHIAMLPVLLSAYLLSIKATVSWKSITLVGFLISIAGLTRLNLAYISIPIGLLIMFNTPYTNIVNKIRNGIIYAMSGILPILIIIWIYWKSGNLEVLYKSLVLAPLSYSSEQYSIWDAFIRMGWHLFSPFTVPYFALKQLVSVMAVVGGFIFLYRFVKYEGNKRIFWVLLVFTLSILYSIIASGEAHPHYLIQLSPFLVIFVAFFLNQIQNYKRFRIFSITTLSIFFVFSFVYWVGGEYKNIASRVLAGESVYQGKSYWVREKLEELNLKNFSLYAMSHHIVYFMTDTYPLTPLSTHPSNITKPFLITSLYGKDATPLHELKKILDTKPTFILQNDSRWYFDGYPSLNECLNEYLEKYTLYDKNGGLSLYVSKDALKILDGDNFYEKN